jgi:hypothetical protein
MWSRMTPKPKYDVEAFIGTKHPITVEACFSLVLG